MKTLENRNSTFSLPEFDLGRAFKPEVGPEVDYVSKMCLELDYLSVFFISLKLKN